MDGNDQPGKYDGHHRGKLNQDIDGGTGSILKGESLPLPPCWPLSMYFLALSQAPPALAIITASTKPVTVVPANNPATPLTPKISPTATGAITAIRAGASISFWALRVHISTQEA